MEKQKNIPKLRFSEFKEEWEKKTLSEVAKNGFSNGAFNDPRKVGSGYRIINVKDMYVDGTINADNITRVAIDEKEFSKNRVEFGDVFFTRSSLVKDGIAHSNINLTDANDLTFDGHLIRMRPKKEMYSPVFLYYDFKTRNVRIQFIQRGKTTTMTTIGQEDIAAVEVAIPTLPEQTRIASFFTVLDKKIAELKQKKTLLEQYKKGVMQKLFSQELRFKDENGKAFPEWEKKKLGEVATFLDEKRVPISEIERQTKKGTYPYYGASGIIDYVYDYLFDGEYILLGEDGANILNRTTELAFIVTGKFWVNNHAHVLQALGNNRFLAEFLERINYEPYNTGTVQPKLNAAICKSIPVEVPCIEEQIKIANFLSAIDEKINRTENQIQKTQEWKKGLLQQMFV